MKSVLVVAYDDETRNRWSDWLDRPATDVMACRGPRQPTYTCLGGQGKPCPLANGAELVVLDLNLASDEAMEGAPAWQLLLYYLEQGCDVVAVTDGEVLLRWLQDDHLLTIPTPVDREALIEAIERIASHRGTWTA